MHVVCYTLQSFTPAKEICSVSKPLTALTLCFYVLFSLQLQTPASFAQSVQELTIALQRTGDPANLNRLRPHLELLANIDPSPGKKQTHFNNLVLVVMGEVIHSFYKVSHVGIQTVTSESSQPSLSHLQ